MVRFRDIPPILRKGARVEVIYDPYGGGRGVTVGDKGTVHSWPEGQSAFMNTSALKIKFDLVTTGRPIKWALIDRTGVVTLKHTE